MLLNSHQLAQVVGSWNTKMLAALTAAEQGWPVFPIRPRSKAPLFPTAHKKNDPQYGKCRGECGRLGHGVWDATTDPDTIRKWWTDNPDAEIGGSCLDRFVVDVDLNHGAEFSDAYPLTKVHETGRANGNAHLVYRFEEGSEVSKVKAKAKRLGEGTDVKIGPGSYVILPGSRHEVTGLLYTLSADRPEHLLTDAEFETILADRGLTMQEVVSPASRAASRGLTVIDGGLARPRAPRSTESAGGAFLSDLLRNPPAEGGRNDWLTRVAGHYAKMHRDKQDLYEIEVARANQMLAEPLADWEVRKTADSIWESETAQHPERSATAENGFLVGNGSVIFIQIARREEDETIYELGPFADFDIQALGVAISEESKRTYWVRLNTRTKRIEATIPGEMFGDERAFKKWLASYGATYVMPPNDQPKMPWLTRLQRYVEAQRPPQVEVVPTLGWHGEFGGFITFDGMITSEGLTSKEESGVVSDPTLESRGIANYHYGFQDDQARAIEVLREVLTFQDEEVTSLFGAWWAAVLLKPQIRAGVSMFPFFGVEAASESGKTNGFFAFMISLSGNCSGQINPTRAVFRDSLSSNFNGIVWMDDVTDLSPYADVLRQVSSGGSVAKMGIDSHSTVSTEMVAAPLLTGEHLGMSEQKALADRSIVVSAPSPTSRESLRTPGLAQWIDVTNLDQQFPGKRRFAVLAGHYQQMAQQRLERVMQVVATTKREYGGRFGDKVAVMLAGAALLDDLLGHEGAWEGRGEHYVRTLAWFQKQDRTMTQDNTLTMKVLPWAFRNFDLMRENPYTFDSGLRSGMISPAFVRNLDEDDRLIDATEVWVSASALADLWKKENAGRIEVRTETGAAFREQLSRVTYPGDGEKVAVHGGNKRSIRFRRLLPEYARQVLARASGD